MFSTSSRPALGPTQPPVQWIPGAFSSGREADRSLPTGAEVKKMWIYTSTPPYACMASSQPRRCDHGCFRRKGFAEHCVNRLVGKGWVSVEGVQIPKISSRLQTATVGKQIEGDFAPCGYGCMTVAKQRICAVPCTRTSSHIHMPMYINVS
jgi:hypothetical protein